MIVEMSDRERRQLELMQQRIDALRSGESPVGPVIADLEALVGELEVPTRRTSPGSGARPL